MIDWENRLLLEKHFQVVSHGTAAPSAHWKDNRTYVGPSTPNICAINQKRYDHKVISSTILCACFVCFWFICGFVVVFAQC